MGSGTQQKPNFKNRGRKNNNNKAGKANVDGTDFKAKLKKYNDKYDLNGGLKDDNDNL